MLGTEEMKYDIRICGLVTLNGKNGNFEMLLVSRKTKKRKTLPIRLDRSRAG